MRVLLTTDTIGGVWTFTDELSHQLLQRGHAVALVSFGRKASSWQRESMNRLEKEYAARFSFTSSLAPLEWMEQNHRAYDDGASVLLDTARDFRADLLHCNQYCFGALPVDLPKLITAHSDVLSWATACRPQGLEYSDWLVQYCELVQRGLDSADVVVAPTRWMINALRDGFDFSCEAKTIYNGRTLSTNDGPLKRLLRAVSAGRLWDEAKGLKTLLEIDSPMPIVVAGEETFVDGEQRNLHKIKALGSLSEPEVFKVFCTSSIYIATSIYEPFGLAPLEAAGCGCAIVARELPSLREVWGDSALYFTDASSLQRVLVRLAGNPEILHAAQKRALARARSFTARRMANEYIASYQRLMNANTNDVDKEVKINAA